MCIIYIAMEILGKLFGSEARVKIMRLFLFNQDQIYDLDMVSQKSKVNKKTVKKEFLALERSALIKRKVFFKIVERKKRGKKIQKKVKSQGYCLNQAFSYLSALRQLLVSGKNLEGDEIVKRLSKAGKLKLVAVAGVFTQDKDSRLDMLVVGNNINKASLLNIIKSIEAELGKELLYAHFETEDFKYRLEMYDKLIRDVLDYPHKVLLDKIGL